MKECGPRIILGNTYHLGLRPGADLVEDMGGLHKFMGWDRNILTDSGGFQMVSLLDLAEIKEEGVVFQSPVDGTKMLLTPEKSIQLQNQIGADIMMALDDVCSSTTEDINRVKEAMERTLRWIDRCIGAHSRPTEQNLFGIVQGGLDEELRRICLEEMKKRNLPGYAIGGLSGGEDKNSFWKVVNQCTEPGTGLPDDKPRYCMGVGYPVDLVVCSALGVDMFDCVYPCRTARFGTVLVPSGLLQLKKAEFKDDFRPIDETCTCSTCKNYTRAYLHTIATKETVASSLLTVHNIAYMMRLMDNVRNAIIEGNFDEYVRNFMLEQYPKKNYPKWASDALTAAGIELIH